MARIEKRERKTGTVYLADVRIRGYPRQRKAFKRLLDQGFAVKNLLTQGGCSTNFQETIPPGYG